MLKKVHKRCGVENLTNRAATRIQSWFKTQLLGTVVELRPAKGKTDINTNLSSLPSVVINCFHVSNDVIVKVARIS